MEEQGRGLGEKMFEFISGLIIGLIIGGFLGMLTMCLCIICRESKASKAMDDCEEDSL